MKIRIIALSLLTILVFTGIYYLLSSASPSLYVNALQNERREKNRSFMISEDSPLKPEQKMRFKGLDYFSPDESWVFSAQWIPVNHADTLFLSMNSGEYEPIVVLGRVEFRVQGKLYSMTAFLNPYDEEFPVFIPFKDKTSGIESYGGGRYLGARENKEGQILLDFNKAYNPFCAYNEDYTCFFPPAENNLPFPVTAGEKFDFEKFK
jgi:uncharacterized protein (DUF1684 family)